MKLIAATGNKNKLREMQEILSPYGYEIVLSKEAGADIEVEETGKTFEENAKLKASAIYRLTKTAVIADDSGLEVDALDKRPGVYSARYAPEGERCSKLLSEMEGVIDENRTARFVCAIYFISESGKETCVRGECEGKIGYEERGSNGFGYDPVFMIGDKSMSELSSDEKNKISHRGTALKKLSEELQKENIF